MELLAQASDDWWPKILASMAGAAVTGFVALVIWWLNKKKPNIIKAQEVELGSLIHVAETVLPRIVVTFDDKVVANLSQLEAAITNDSHETLKDVVLKIDFPAKTTVLECQIAGITATYEIVVPSHVTIKIPYINSMKDHGDKIAIKVNCDGPIAGYTLTGRGDGWSAKHVTIRQLERRKQKIMIALLTMNLIFTLIVVATSLDYKPPSEDLKPIDYKRLALTLPMVVGMALCGYYINAEAYKSGRRRGRMFR